MVEIKGNDLYITYGDTVPFIIKPKYHGSYTKYYNFQLGDKIIMTVKRVPDIEETAIQIITDNFSNGFAELIITRDMYSKIVQNKFYSYDIEIIFGKNGWNQTIKKGKIMFLSEVGTYAE